MRHLFSFIILLSILFSQYGSIKLDGNGDGVYIYNSNLPTGESNYSMAFWINVVDEELSPYRAFIQASCCTYYEMIGIALINRNGIGMNTGGSQWGSNTDMIFDDWVHIAYTRSSGNVFTVYMNGQQIHTFDLDDSAQSVVLSPNNWIINWGNAFWEGNIANISIWQGSLSQSDIQNLMYDPLYNSNNPSLLAQYNLANIDDAVVVDDSGNGNYLIYHNATVSTSSPYGCTDENACNYNSEAVMDNGSCEYLSESCDCDGNPIGNYCDCDGNLYDCSGECGGTSELDCFDICQGTAIIDDCGICGGANIDVDECGICFGDNSTCTGCTDSDAHNYDETATIDDGSCIVGPDVISIYDTPEDQGGYVFLNWSANNLDALPNEIITHYSIYRYLPNQRGWELLDEVPASYDDDYGYVAPTIQTSIPDDYIIYETEFRVRANTPEQSVFYDSDVVSGYSIDNLAPTAPTLLMGTHTDNSLHLNWSYELEEDFNYHEISSLTQEPVYATDTLGTVAQTDFYNAYKVQTHDVHNNTSDTSNPVSGHRLHYGNNLIGIPVLPDNTSVTTVLGSLGANGNGIIGQGLAANNLNGQYVGSLTNIDPSKGYWVNVTADDMLLIPGNAVDCESITYNLVTGYHLLSYCCGSETDLTQIPASCQAIVGEGIAANYVEGVGWVGSLQGLEPGKGFWLQCSEPVEFQWNCE